MSAERESTPVSALAIEAASEEGAEEEGLFVVPAAEALMRWACETTAGSEPSAFEPFAAAIEAESDEAADA